ncbi:MAG: ATPase, T2SS/T4P/T4SS family [Planctomycetota bacterium]
MPYLKIQEPDGQERVTEIDDERFVIGKRSSCDLVLKDSLVSREHCIILNDASGKSFLRDRDSRNGTFINGHKVEADVMLRDGMEIHVGHVRMTFKSTPPAPFNEESSGESEVKQQGLEREEIRVGDDKWEKSKSAPVELKREVHELLLDRLDLKYEEFGQQTDDEIRYKAERTIRDIAGEFAGELPPGVSKEDLIKEVADEALGLGPLEVLLEDEEVDEIMVNGWDSVYVERHGRIEKTKLKFTSDTQVKNIIRRIVAPIGRRIDESSPMVDARLPDGSRVNAIIAPLALTGPTLTIRKFATDPFKISDLISFATLTRQMSEFLNLAVKYRQNILISGGTGSGKTTLLNVVSSNIPEEERIVTIEDSAELQLPQEHVVSLESKPPNIRGEGAIPIRELVINSLRMRPDRIIVGECRGGEAMDMLQAMNTGHDGSLTTLHANSPRDSLSRLETLVLMAGLELPSRAIREQISAAINIIVHTSRLSDGSRKVMNIEEVRGIEGDVFTLQSLYAFRQQGFDEEGNVRGYFSATGNAPEFVRELRERGIDVDQSMFEIAPKEKERRESDRKRHERS